ncbi:MAG: c-type cytochrome [Pseudobdellovibrionaceae bacterium]
MLSKSQAKSFFLTGTFICIACFLALTVDTFNKIPAQTKQENLTPQVIRGKHLWDSNNCMGCHTIMGEGAYYAPELTKVFERRGEIFIKSMLRDPQAMFPNDRKMVNYHFNEEQINDLTAFLKWIGEMDLNGFPAKPDLAMPGKTTTNGDTGLAKNAVVVPTPTVFTQTCTACHSYNGQGGTVGPALDGVASRRDEDYLRKRLVDPTSVQADAKMPKLPLSEKDVSELVAFLKELK